MFTISDIVTEQIEQYKNEADSSYLFLQELGYVPDCESNKLLKEIYSEYKDYCRENNYIAFSNRNFKKRLVAHGFAAHRSRLGQIIYCIIDPSKTLF